MSPQLPIPFNSKLSNCHQCHDPLVYSLPRAIDCPGHAVRRGAEVGHCCLCRRCPGIVPHRNAGALCAPRQCHWWVLMDRSARRQGCLPGGRAPRMSPFFWTRARCLRSDRARCRTVTVVLLFRCLRSADDIQDRSIMSGPQSKGVSTPRSRDPLTIFFFLSTFLNRFS